MYILNTIAMANENEMNKVFNKIINRARKDKPRILFNHCFKIFPKRTKGNKLKKIKNNGTI